MSQPMQQLGPQEADDIHAEFRQVMRAIAQRLDQAQYRLGIRRPGTRAPGRRRRRNETRRDLERQYPVAQLVARWGVAERASHLAQERARAAAKDPALSGPQRAAAHQDAEIAKAHATAWERRAHAYGVDTDQLRGMLSEHEQRDAAPTSSSPATTAGPSAAAAATSAAPAKDVFNTVGEDELHTYRQHQTSLDDAEAAPAASAAGAGGAIPDPPQAPGTAVTSSALSTATAAVAATLAAEYVDEHLHFGPVQSHIDLDAVSGADLIDSAQVNADKGLDLSGVSPTATDLSIGQIQNLDNVTGMEL